MSQLRDQDQTQGMQGLLRIYRDVAALARREIDASEERPLCKDELGVSNAIFSRVDADQLVVSCDEDEELGWITVADWLPTNAELLKIPLLIQYCIDDGNSPYVCRDDFCICDRGTEVKLCGRIDQLSTFLEFVKLNEGVSNEDDVVFRR